jgi:hypothetical protein
VVLQIDGTGGVAVPLFREAEVVFSGLPEPENRGMTATVTGTASPHLEHSSASVSGRSSMALEPSGTMIFLPGSQSKSFAVTGPHPFGHKTHSVDGSVPHTGARFCLKARAGMYRLLMLLLTRLVVQCHCDFANEFLWRFAHSGIAERHVFVPSGMGSSINDMPLLDPSCGLFDLHVVGPQPYRSLVAAPVRVPTSPPLSRRSMRMSVSMRDARLDKAPASEPELDRRLR